MSDLTLGHFQIAFGIALAVFGIVSGLNLLRRIRGGAEGRPQPVFIIMGASVVAGIGLCLIGLYSDIGTLRLT